MLDEVKAEVVQRSLEGIAQQEGVLVHAIGIMPDHVHLALSIPPRHAVAGVVNKLKGSSSHMLNHQYAENGSDWPGWQPEYGVLSFGPKALTRVVDYVVNQRDRHASQDLIGALERLDDR